MGWFGKPRLMTGDAACSGGGLFGTAMERLKQDIEYYTRLVRSLAQDAADQNIDDGDSDVSRSESQEHDQLLFRALNAGKSPRLTPKPWLPSEQEDSLSELKVIEEAEASKRVAGELTVSDLRCLRPLEWLNDEVMNRYAELVNAACAKLELPVHCWNTFFWTNLVNSETGAYDYSKVRRWTKRRKIDIFELDLMFVPLHVNHVHWSLGLVDFKSKLIFFFDSLGNRAPDMYLRYVRRYIQDEFAEKHPEEEPLSGEEFLYAGNNFALSQCSAINADVYAALRSAVGDVRDAVVPLQQNGSDCGVFTCLFMRELAFNRYPFLFSNDMTGVRRSMLLDILKGELELPV